MNIIYIYVIIGVTVCHFKEEIKANNTMYQYTKKEMKINNDKVNQTTYEYDFHKRIKRQRKKNKEQTTMK